MELITAAKLAGTRNRKGITIRDAANVHGIDATLQEAFEIYPGRYIVRIKFANGTVTEKVYSADHQFFVSFAKTHFVNYGDAPVPYCRHAADTDPVTSDSSEVTCSVCTLLLREVAEFEQIHDI